MHSAKVCAASLKILLAIIVLYRSTVKNGQVLTDQIKK